jgi:TolB-like protein/tetratricopeptide (TPR) repeat protein
MQKLSLPPPTSAATPHAASRLRAEVSIESVQVAMDKVLACESFAKSPKHRCFLEFVVGEALAGRDGNLKEYTIGVEAFGRPESFDSREDPIVRVTASRVRAKLKAYFENEGKDAPLVIELPRGRYVPLFSSRPDAVAVKQQSSEGNVPVWQFKKWLPVSWILSSLVTMIAIALWIFAANRGPGVALASAARQGGSLGIVNSHSIAVLPFVSVGPDSAADYTARWLTDAVADVLGNVGSRPGLSSAALIEPSWRPGSEAQKYPGPDKVLQGWVSQNRGHARITAQLIDLRSRLHVWSDVYECDPKDIFQLQHTIVADIVRKLAPPRDTAGHVRPSAQAAPNLEALNFYLDGLYQMEHRTRPALLRAIDYFQKSLSISSSGFSLAYSRLAEAYSMLTRYGVMPSTTALPKARIAAERALEIDQESADAHAALALVESLNWRWNDAFREFQHAIKLDPSNAAIREEYALNYLVPMRRLDEALDQLQKAKTIDPFSSNIEVSLGRVNYYKGNNDEAIGHCRKALNLQPGSQEAVLCLGAAFEQKAMFSQSTDVLSSAGSPARDIATGSLSGRIFSLEGGLMNARALLLQFRQFSKEQNPSYYHLTLVYLGLNNPGQALSYIEKAYQEHDPLLVDLAVSPAWKHIRAEPRFVSVLAQMGLPTV